MPKFQKLREAKQIGNAIRKARIAKGEALTNISGVFKISIMELNAIEEREMRMSDYIRELDNIMSYTGRKVLDGAGTISHNQAHDKAVEEYKK
jgi:hypothetical protein